jgi:hypothetical protein
MLWQTNTLVVAPDRSTAFLRRCIPDLGGDTVPARLFQRVAVIILLGSLLWLGVADQNEAYTLNWIQADGERTFRNQTEFVRRIEARLPDSAMCINCQTFRSRRVPTA